MLSGEAALHAHAVGAMQAQQPGLSLVGGGPVQVEHYSYGGYVTMMGFGGAVAFLSAVVTSFIKNAK